MNNDFHTHKVALTDAAESTGGPERQLEWAVGTDFVWVTGGDAMELYMVEVPANNMADARVVKTITNVASGDLLFVDNFARKSAMQAMEAMVKAKSAILSDDSGNQQAGAVNQLAASLEGPVEDDGSDTDPLAIAALAVACVALVMSATVALALFTTQSSKPGMVADTDTTAANGPSDSKTLGSKMVA